MKYIGVLLCIVCLVLAGCSSDSQPESIVDKTPHFNKSDSLTMIKIYQSIGAPWGKKWDLADVTTWNGVTAALDVATNEIRIIGFECYQGGFTGTLTDEICKLTELRRLVISGGTMNGTIPEHIGNLKNLELLIIADNNVTGGIPESIGNLSNLRHLDFRNTKLYDTIPESIGDLTNLEYLCISHTDMHGNIPKGLANLKKLRRVILTDNKLSGTFPVEILRNDLVFECDNNNITELPFEVWNDEWDVYPPILKGNRLSGEIPEWVLKTNKWKKESCVCIGPQQKGFGYSNYSSNYSIN